MKSNENLLPSPEAPRGFLSRVVTGTVNGVRTVLKTIFPPEDPEVAKLLTPKFREEFSKAYYEALAKFRSGELRLDPDKKQSSAFLDALERQGIETTFDAFQYVLDGYPAYSLLNDDQQSRVRWALLEHCGLIPGGL